MQCFVDFAVGALSYTHTVGPSGPNQTILLSQCEREVCMSGPLSDSAIYTTPAVHRDCHTDRQKSICNIKILYNNNLAYMSNFLVH